MPTTIPGTSNRSTLATRVTSHQHSTWCVVSTMESGIACTPSPLSAPRNVSTVTPNREPCTFITNPLPTRHNDRNRCQRQWLHLDQYSPAVVVSMDLVTQTWHILYLHLAESWSSTCGTDCHVWVQATLRFEVVPCNMLQKHQLRPHTGRK